jgi:hypothetical protein
LWMCLSNEIVNSKWVHSSTNGLWMVIKSLLEWNSSSTCSETKPRKEAFWSKKNNECDCSGRPIDHEVRHVNLRYNTKLKREDKWVQWNWSQERWHTRAEFCQTQLPHITRCA